MSYGGGLHFGLIADRDLVPDLDVMAGYLVDELKILVHAVVPDEPPVPSVATTPRKPAKRTRAATASKPAKTGEPSGA